MITALTKNLLCLATPVKNGEAIDKRPEERKRGAEMGIAQAGVDAPACAIPSERQIYSKEELL